MSFIIIITPLHEQFGHSATNENRKLMAAPEKFVQ